MTPFELAEPRTLDEALGLLDREDTSVRPAGGCTALMLMMKAGVLKPRRLVSLRRIEARYFGIEARDGMLRIGAQATLRELERSGVIGRAAPAVQRALRRLANVRVRNVATLGGHLAHADPHMDLPPLLTALGAQVRIKGRAGERALAIEDLLRGYMETALAPDELITEVDVSMTRARYCAYSKVTTRSADDWPALGVAVALEVADGAVRDARVVIGAAVDRPTRLQSVERLLLGRSLQDLLGTEAQRRGESPLKGGRDGSEAPHSLSPLPGSRGGSEAPHSSSPLLDRRGGSESSGVVEARAAAAADVDTIADKHGELTRVYVRRTLQAALAAGAQSR
jgi:carbon-monoxide dehydrogenase medium subunit